MSTWGGVGAVTKWFDLWINSNQLGWTSWNIDMKASETFGQLIRRLWRSASMCVMIRRQKHWLMLWEVHHVMLLPRSWNPYTYSMNCVDVKCTAGWVGMLRKIPDLCGCSGAGLRLPGYRYSLLSRDEEMPGRKLQGHTEPSTSSSSSAKFDHWMWPACTFSGRLW